MPLAEKHLNRLVVASSLLAVASAGVVAFDHMRFDTAVDARVAALLADAPDLALPLNAAEPPRNSRAIAVDSFDSASPTARAATTRTTSRGTVLLDTYRGEVVGSRTGRVYHALQCSGAARIKPENQVRFASPAEAADRGYRPAKNCFR